MPDQCIKEEKNANLAGKAKLVLAVATEQAETWAGGVEFKTQPPESENRGWDVAGKACTHQRRLMPRIEGPRVVSFLG